MNHWFVDGMSLIHLVIGIGLGLFRVRLWLMLAVAITWEVAEHVLKIHRPAMFVFPTQDSLMNALGDILFAAVGWMLAGRIGAAGGVNPASDRRPARRTIP